MKILQLSVFAMLMASAMVGCAPSDDEASASKEAATVGKTDKDGNELSGIRYYNLDSIKAKYNLAKDYDEAAMRLQRNLESTANSRSASVQKAAESFQTKLNGGQFATEAEAQKAYSNVQQMQTNAANELDNLQRNTAKQLANMEQEMADSITSVINYIGSTNGLEAIIVTSPGLYFDPKLDITDAVIDELNKRYTKVAETK